jgi:nitroreductase
MLADVEFRDVLRRRRMVRAYDEDRPVPPDVIERLLRAAVRAPSAGFTQGWGFLVLDTPEDVELFREAATPESDPDRWFAANVRAPLIIVAHSNQSVYVARYEQPDKGLDKRSDPSWPAPYWDIDAGFASMLVLLTAVDEGLGACFFGIPPERIDDYRRAFGVPDEFRPIGAISIGYQAEPAKDITAHRKPLDEVVHRGRWNSAG